MTVDRDSGISESFVGSGTTGPFAVTNFNIATTDQIEPGGVVKVADATGVATTLILDDPGANGYTAVISGGLVTINTISAVASGYTLNVLRDTNKLQTVSLPIIGLFRPRDVEEALDLLAMQVQELKSTQDGPLHLGSALNLGAVDSLSVGWADNSQTWNDIEVSAELVVVGTARPAIQVSLDDGASAVVLNYEWVSMHSYGNGAASTVDGYVSVTAAERTHWRLSGNVLAGATTAYRLVGNFRISQLEPGRSIKIVGACTFNSSSGQFVHVNMSGTLDAQPSRINGIILTDDVTPNNVAGGSRLDVRGIR